MDDVRLLTLTSLRGARHVPPKPGRRGSKVSLFVGSSRVEEEEVIYDEASALSLRSISKGGLPAVDAKTKTKFYNMMRLKGSETTVVEESALPGMSSPKKKSAKKKKNRGTTTPPSSPPQPQPRPSGQSGKSRGSKRSNNNQQEHFLDLDEGSPTMEFGRRPASTSSPIKQHQQQRVDRRPASVSALRGEHMDMGSSSASATVGVAPSSRQSAATMSRLHRALTQQQQDSLRDESATRLQLMQSGDRMVLNLPLPYLASRPDLRPYAIEKAVSVFYRLAMKKGLEECRRAVEVWKNPPEIIMNEVQVGFMVIAKRLENLLRRALSIKFQHWAHLHSSRFLGQRDDYVNQCAAEIQRWFRLQRVLKREPFKRLLDAILVCLQRRKAIKFAIDMETERRRAQAKIYRAVISRRRRHFAARAIIRVRRWVFLYRKTTWKLTRSRSARALQRWWLMILCRPEKDRALIRFIVSVGGSRVLQRVIKACQALPPRKSFIREGFLQSINRAASMLQKAWLNCKGQAALYLLAAMRRAKEERDKMLNDNATVIQQNWRGFLWYKLCRTAVQWNRARRIQRGFRAYQYRCWVTARMAYRKQRYVRMLQRKFRRWMTRKVLAWRLKARKALLIFTRAKKSLCANMIQRQFRLYKERERIKKEQLLAMIAGLRAQADVVVKSVSKIQKNWRLCKNLDWKGNGKRFPLHVRLIIEKVVRKARLRVHDMAKKIQRRVIIFLKEVRKIRRRLHRKMANKIWRLAKSYLVKLAIFDRVEARKRREMLASNTMKRNFRRFLFARKIYNRGRLRGVQRLHKQLLHDHATYIQRWHRRKMAEYYVLPMRKASRLNLAKKRDSESDRRRTAVLNKASRVISRFFSAFPRWSHFIRRLAKDTRYYVERKAAKKMQKFARRVVAWARFDRVVAYRKRAVALAQIDPFLTHCVNIIGHYWKRFKEKRVLEQRFVLRAKMLEEWKRLEELRKQAYEEKRIAEEDKKRTDENMAATIRASWKQGADEKGRNYYYNFVTGATSWVPPDDWKAPVKDVWMRQTDDKDNVYYYNMMTGASQWLPPCCICGEQGERHCADCTLAYCERDWELHHVGAEAEDETWAEHKWSLTEYASDILQQGEVYCIDCKKRTATVTCLTCWDHYCKVCFNFVHHVGALKYHKAQAYFKAKKGWYARKATDPGEQDFYVNGTTGETTYDKPEELMSHEELIYFKNFKSHEQAALDHIEKIKQLQFDMEAIAYERDTILERSMQAGIPIGDILAKRKKKKANRFEQEGGYVDVIQEVAKVTKPGYRLFSTSFAEYRQSILSSKPRPRGAEKSKMIEDLINSGSPGKSSPPGKKSK